MLRRSELDSWLLGEGERRNLFDWEHRGVLQHKVSCGHILSAYSYSPVIVEQLGVVVAF